MKRFTRSNASIARCAAIALAAGSATAASGTDKHWTCAGGGVWSTASCWSPVGLPASTDAVHIGNVVGVQNSTVRLDINDSIGSLGITDGMTLDTNGSLLSVQAIIDISGRNTVGSNSYPSRLVVDQVLDGAEVSAQVVNIQNQGEVQLSGGGISVDGLVSIGAGSFLRGAGVIWSYSDSNNFTNNGTIAPTGAMTLYQVGAGHYDLDGASGGGDLDLTAASNSSLTLTGDGLAEAFGGTLGMVRGTFLNMALDNPWTVENSGTFNIYGSGTGSAARVLGAPLNFNGAINLYGGSLFSLESDVTFGASSDFFTGTNATADITGDAVVNGGIFTINEGSNLDFDGHATIHGGSFSTFSDVSTTGSVDFNGVTSWDGNVTFSGFARQNGPAQVTGPTVITADTFDMDGSDAANWDINANLTLNADRIDYGGNSFNTTMNIGAGRLNVNLTDPGAWWFLAGITNLSGNNLLFSTKIGGGSELHVTGTINVVGKCDIVTQTGFTGSATINIPAAGAALRFMSDVFIDNGVTFTGGGTLQNGANSVMTFHTGTNTGGMGVHNAGTLRVSTYSGGIMSVDRFTTTGTWEVDIGGHVAGIEHDRLVSNGPSVIGGTVDVHLINGFHPVVGDEFTILNAVGGVSGSFAPNVTSSLGVTTYHWDVFVSGTDVILRLASIQTPCRADFNADGFVNSQDFFDFVTRFFALSPLADFNADGFVNSQDFFDFLTAFFSGC